MYGLSSLYVGYIRIWLFIFLSHFQENFDT